MSSFLRGLSELERLRADRELERPAASSSDLTADPLEGARFREGDRVLDPVTGERGEVVRVTFRHVTIPVTRR